jgi:hypothetical protein
VQEILKFFQRRVSFCGPGIKNGFEANRDRQVFARFCMQEMNRGRGKSGVAT